jgi:predicted Rossmann fold nucleotide-binding protein DprA/Smf involved in DNA uptake
MNLTRDAQAMLLLCSHLGMAGRSDLTPLTLREWNSLARQLQTSSLQRPGAMLGLSAADLERELDLSTDTEPRPERLARLLERGGALAIEMERLGSLGIWVKTRADDDYPQRLRTRLKGSAPPVLFGVGEAVLIGQPGLAVVGSRHTDARRQELAGLVGNACGRCGLVLYSGGAAGVDRIATTAAIAARGSAVSVLAHSLEQVVRAPETRSAVACGDLALVTPYVPNAGFSAGAAMGRNKLIYALADYALVVASDAGKGGTWGGATEALRHGWVPVYVLESADMPEGNRQLLQRGALPFPEQSASLSTELRRWLEKHSAGIEPPPVQARMF